MLVAPMQRERGREEWERGKERRAGGRSTGDYIYGTNRALNANVLIPSSFSLFLFSLLSLSRGACVWGKLGSISP